jgi:hypothetical protein
MATNNANNNSDVPLAGGTMTGLLVLSADPAVALGACTKQYADAIAAGATFKAACYAGSTTALTVTYSNGAAGVGATLTNAGAQAAFSIDGVSPPITSRILIKNQASTFQNGCYSLTVVGTGATNWVLTRVTDYDSSVEIVPGTIFPVDNGTTNGLTSWVETATVTTVGTDPITFSQFTSAPLALPVAVTSGGTGVSTLTTAYGTLVAGTSATNPVQTVATGTSGQPLVSAGNAAVPAYGTLGVIGGGTGLITSTTSYAVVCSGTTATGAYQVLSALGASGTVLTSNGAGALPSFQAAGGGGITIGKAYAMSLLFGR